MPDTPPLLTLSVRRAEVLAILGLAADQAMGQPADQALAIPRLAVPWARALGADDDEAGIVYALSMLRYIGCHAEARLAADTMRDEIAARARIEFADKARPTELIGAVIGSWRPEPLWERAKAVVHTLSTMPKLMENTNAHCEVGAALAVELGLPGGVRHGLHCIFERPDGKGIPNGLRGDDVPRAVQIVTAAGDALAAHRAHGLDAARAVLQTRSGGGYSGAIVKAFDPEWLIAADGSGAFQAVLDLEPGERTMLSSESLDAALRGVAFFADIKSPSRVGHSERVAEIAAEAGRAASLPSADQALLRGAGLVHDIGVAAVPAGILEKRGALGDAERERLHVHALAGERCLARSPTLARLAAIAGAAHERADGSGYPRGNEGGAMQGRLLAAADVWAGLTADRPHRRALSAADAKRAIEADGKAGKLDPGCVDAVLAAVGQGARRRAPPDLNLLSEREGEVLPLLAKGLTNKEIAARLSISPKTVGHHVQHIFEKLDASTRAGAAFQAARLGLLGSDSP